MTNEVVFKIMDGVGCLTSHKKQIIKDGKRSDETRIVDKCHGHYSDVVEDALKEQKEALYKELSDIYDTDENYGKKLSINIQFQVSLNPD